MSGILSILGWIGKLGFIVKFGKILWNAPTLYRFAKKFGPLAESVIKEKRLPRSAETVEFLHASAVLLRTEIVDFPGIEEKDLADKLDELATEIGKAA